jgi:Family of unknown function (DUF6088)
VSKRDRKPTSKESQSVAKQVRQRVERGGERFWRHDDFGDLPPTAVAMALSRLTREGALRRPRKGVYFRPGQTAFGPSIPAASASAAQTLRAPLHPAGLTAANVLGLTTQNPARLEYATPAHDPPSALTGADVRTRRPASRKRLPEEDGALLELLRDRGRSTDLSPERTYQRLNELLNDPTRFARLARAALDEPPRVRAMLGALGTEAGADPRALERLRKSLNPLSRFYFGVFRDLPRAGEWQAK